jgi:hypothetical protein
MCDSFVREGAFSLRIREGSSSFFRTKGNKELHNWDKKEASVKKYLDSFLVKIES